MGFIEDKKRHDSLNLIGLRAHATAVGLIQLCIELRQVGVIGAESIERIKVAIADDLALSAPRSLSPEDFRSNIERRLDKLFSGEEQVGPAEDGLVTIEGAQRRSESRFG